MSADYEIWNLGEHGSADIYFIPYKYKEIWELERRVWNPDLAHKMFTLHWHLSIYLVITYIAGVHLLKRWMRHRKAFELQPLLIIWNTALAVFSATGAWRFGEEFAFVMRNRTFQDSVCLSISPTEPVAFWGLCFVLSKVAEFGDTILLVLRKKPLIFLHWFHHSVVLVYSWHSATELTAAGRWFIQLNYMVHSIMYTYYAVTSAGFRPPKWISMGVTTLQTSQMLIGIFISLYVAHLKWNGNPGPICQQSVQNMCICFAIYSAFAFLFIRFFIKAYCRRESAEEKVKQKVH